MKIFYTSLLLFFLLLFSAVSEDTISVEIIGNSATVWHKHISANCGSKFMIDIKQDSTNIVITETDTSTQWAFCDCYFDLSTTFSYMDPGNYTVHIFRKEKVPMYPKDTTYFIDSIDFHINPGPVPQSKIDFHQSECLGNAIIVDPPPDYQITKVYPNPAKSQISISFNAAQAGQSVVKCYNILGNEVLSAGEIILFPGYYEISINTKNLPTGVYYIRLFMGMETYIFPVVSIIR